MAHVLRTIYTAVVDFSIWAGVSKREGDYKLGAYPVDYSQPTQAEIDAANASSAGIFKEGNWISVNRKS